MATTHADNLPSITDKTTYRDMIKQEFASRCARNSHYSLRAFARDLGLSPASLSTVLAGRQGLSRQAAKRISERLGLNPGEGEFFRDLVESVHGRSARERELAGIRLRQHDRAGRTLHLDAFRAISDWYHLAILELTGIEGFDPSPRWIAKTLGINAKAADLALERLKKLGLLTEKDGHPARTGGFVATPSGIPSSAIKKFHSQILGKAEEALYTQEIARRDFSAVIVPISDEDLSWAQDRIKAFRREFTERMIRSRHKKTSVYALAVQFFGLQKPHHR